MAVRWFALACLVGCSFTPGAPQGENGSGNPIDAPVNPGRDAPGATDAPADAKVFLDAAAVTGSISITVTPYGNQSHDVKLTTEGVTDWAHWGLASTSSFDHKLGGTSISNLATTPSGRFTGAPLTSTWANGTPDAAATATSSGVACKQGSSMVFTVAAGTTAKTMHLYVGVQQAAARLDVSLSDNSAAAQSKTYQNTNATDNVEYTITFNAASAGQTLRVSWSDTADYAGSSAFAALLSATVE